MKPPGYPDVVDLERIKLGQDVSWKFDIITKVLPPFRLVREMYGVWCRYIPLAANGPYVPIIPESLASSIEDKVWVCRFKVLVASLGDVRKGMIVTTRLAEQELFTFSFDVNNMEALLEHAMGEFAHGLGVWP